MKSADVQVLIFSNSMWKFFLLKLHNLQKSVNNKCGGDKMAKEKTKKPASKAKKEKQSDAESKQG